MLKSKKVYTLPITCFLGIILITTILLKLPICNNLEISYIDAFFEATSNVTATGSNVVDISQQFTWLGQFVLLCAMQIGAIGFMLFFSLIFMISKKKLSLTDTIFLSNEMNTNNYTSIKEKAKKITRYTLIIEALGAWLLAFRFVPMYGFGKGLWYSAFHAVSAFCNVGSDLFNNQSFLLFRSDIYINLVLMGLMFLGSIGFFVLEDLVAWFSTGKKNKIHVESKLVLYTTFLVIFLSTILIRIFESKITMFESLFSVIGARNAGFYTVDVATLHEMSQFLLTIVMFIGGGPGSNSGGIRVVVLAVLVLTSIANIRNHDEVVVFYRTVPDKMIKKAITILCMDGLIVFVGMLGISFTENMSLLDTLFYVVSCFSNTGLSTIGVADLTFAGKCITAFVMYIGRIAPITFVSLFIPTKDKKSGMKYPNMDIIL